MKRSSKRDLQKIWKRAMNMLIYDGPNDLQLTNAISEPNKPLIDRQSLTSSHFVLPLRAVPTAFLHNLRFYCLPVESPNCEAEASPGLLHLLATLRRRSVPSAVALLASYHSVILQRRQEKEVINQHYPRLPISRATNHWQNRCGYQ